MPFIQYTPEHEKQWDTFLFENALNANFLQSKQFLNYHPEDRFEDASLLYFDKKNNLRALIPAVRVQEKGRMLFVSHPGTTYGGFLFDKKTASAKRLQALVEEFKEYLKEAGYNACKIKVIPDFMWRGDGAHLLEYLLQYNGFVQRGELTTYIDYARYGENTKKRFAQGKRTNVNNAQKLGLRFELLHTQQQAQTFYGLLCKNLERYDAKPVHTFDEMWDLYSNRLKGTTEMVGIFNEDDEMLAAGWFFLFKNLNIAHTQYLCAHQDYGKLSPMTYLYYSLIEYGRELGIDYLSWGISTEEDGAILNWGLTESKESYGSSHGVHRSFSLNLDQTING